MEIIIGQRGWVWVGHPRREGDQVIIEGARCIRRWGTTGGLAQLANSGPQRETQLEEACSIKLHVLGIVGSYLCNESAWRK